MDEGVLGHMGGWVRVGPMGESVKICMLRRVFRVYMCERLYGIYKTNTCKIISLLNVNYTAKLRC